MVLVHIAGGDHDIGQLPRLDHRDQALAAGGIAAPAVEIGAAGAARVGIQERHHHDLLGQQVLALAPVQPLLQPGRLGVAQDRRARRGVQRQAAVQRLGPADLAAAELAGVQHLDAQQVAPVDPAMHAHRAGDRERRTARDVCQPGADEAFMWKDVKSDPVDGRVRTKLHNGPVWLSGWENHDCATDLLQPSSRVVTGAAALRQ